MSRSSETGCQQNCVHTNIFRFQIVSSWVIRHRIPLKISYNNLKSQGKNRVLHTPLLQETSTQSSRISTDTTYIFPMHPLRLQYLNYIHP